MTFHDASNLFQDARFWQTYHQAHTTDAPNYEQAILFSLDEVFTEGNIILLELRKKKVDGPSDK